MRAESLERREDRRRARRTRALQAPRQGEELEHDMLPTTESELLLSSPWTVIAGSAPGVYGSPRTLLGGGSEEYTVTALTVSQFSTNNIRRFLVRVRSGPTTGEGALPDRTHATFVIHGNSVAPSQYLPLPLAVRIPSGRAVTVEVASDNAGSSLVVEANYFKGLL